MQEPTEITPQLLQGRAQILILEELLTPFPWCVLAQGPHVCSQFHGCTVTSDVCPWNAVTQRSEVGPQGTLLERQLRPTHTGACLHADHRGKEMRTEGHPHVIFPESSREKIPLLQNLFWSLWDCDQTRVCKDTSATEPHTQASALKSASMTETTRVRCLATC